MLVNELYGVKLQREEAVSDTECRDETNSESELQRIGTLERRALEGRTLVGSPEGAVQSSSRTQIIMSEVTKSHPIIGWRAPLLLAGWMPQKRDHSVGKR